MITAAESFRRGRRTRPDASRFPKGGVTYLNSRHYDPATGVFVSVDPLVTLTGEPYIYGSASPVTMSDPSGLCSMISGDLWCSGVNFRDGNFGKGRNSVVATTFDPIVGSGSIKIDQFIAASRTGLPGARDAGNDRDFDLDAPMSESKVQILVDLDRGRVTATAAGSCDANGNGCKDARPWELISPDDTPSKTLNNLSVDRDENGLRIKFRGLNTRRSDRWLAIIPSIDGVYRFGHSDRTLTWREKGDPFPSEQVSWTPSGSAAPQELFRYTEKVNFLARSPRLSTHSWRGLSNDFR